MGLAVGCRIPASRLLCRVHILHLHSFFGAEAPLFLKKSQALPESGLRLPSRICCQGLFLREQLLAKGGKVLIMAEAPGKNGVGKGRGSFSEKQNQGIFIFAFVSLYLRTALQLCSSLFIFESDKLFNWDSSGDPCSLGPD